MKSMGLFEILHRPPTSFPSGHAASPVVSPRSHSFLGVSCLVSYAQPLYPPTSFLAILFWILTSHFISMLPRKTSTQKAAW